MNQQKRAKERGRNFERRVAKQVHGIVVGRSKAVKVGDKWIQINPQRPPDVVNEWISIECKYLKSLPVWLDKVMIQAIRNAPDGLVPVAFVGGREDNSRFVIMTERDFLDLHER